MARGTGPADTPGLSYAEVIASVRSRLTGDFDSDAALIMAAVESCKEHPQAQEILRELGRMLYSIAPDSVRAQMDAASGAEDDTFDRGIMEARAHAQRGDAAAARAVLEDLIREFGTGSGRFQDDTVSEYRRFANGFEFALYERLYRPARQVREMPHDRATLYTLYGGVMVELREMDRAEEALREALRVNPVGTAPMFELGEVMKLAGRRQEFRELTVRAMEVAYTGEALARGYRNLGYLAIEEADYDLAVACYCMSLVYDGEHPQMAQSELFYIQQLTGSTINLPDPETAKTRVATGGIQVGPSELVTQLMDAVGGGD